MFKYKNISDQEAILVHIFFSKKDDLYNLQEFKSLVYSAGIKINKVITSSLITPHIKYFIGKGKALEILDSVKLNDSLIVIFNHDLTPAQERNLENLCKCHIINRTELILNIFAQRARSHEGKLQVELAYLRYMTTRLVHGWSHLERQKGGIGLRGPGESQLETDRRLLHFSITKTVSKLKKIEKQREQMRHLRIKSDVQTISLVGYTNSGKSTLFNQITNANVYTANQLFATLDTTTRRIKIKNIGEIILIDTVGFIRHLPHDLIAAFKATLKEISQSTLILHIIDSNSQRIEENINAVNYVLKEINAYHIPKLLVMNKIDILNDVQANIDRDEKNKPIKVWLSAHTGAGVSLLLETLNELLSDRILQYTILLPPYEGRLRSKFYQLNAIEKEHTENNGNLKINLRISASDWYRLCKQEPFLFHYII